MKERLIPVSAPLGFAGGCYRPVPMQKPHLHQEIELNYLLAGKMTYLAAGRIVHVSSRRLTVFWGTAPHQLISVEGVSRFYWFTIPFAWMLQWKLSRAFTESLLHGRFMIDGEEAGDDQLLARWDADLVRGDAEHLRIAQLEIEGRLRRLIVRYPRSLSRKARPVGGGVSAVQTIVEFIGRHYTKRLTIAEIARPTGLHPNYAMALFRDTCGMSILDSLIEHRLFHARRLLATTDFKVIDIAMESGFGSLSRFNEAFVHAAGCSPREYRKQFAPRV